MLLLFILVQVAASTLPRYAGKESNNARATIILNTPTATTLHPNPIVAYDKYAFNTLSSLPIQENLQLILFRAEKMFRTGCSPFQITTSAPWALVVDRGNCTFETKVKHATEAGASALFVLNTPSSLKSSKDVLIDVCSVYAHHTSDGLLECDTDSICDDSLGKINFKLSSRDQTSARCCIDVQRSVGEYRQLGPLFNASMPFLFLSVPDARVLTQAMDQASSPLIATVQHRSSKLDGSGICTWLIGCVACFISSYFAATKERSTANKKFWLPLGDNMMDDVTTQNKEEEEDVELVEILTWKHAIAMLCCSGVTLLFLYALIKAGFNALVFIMQLFFGYAVTVATFKMVFYPLFKRIQVIHSNKKQVNICGETENMPMSVPISFFCSVSVAVIWGVTRHSSWSWVLLDLLGLLVCCLVVQTMRIAGLRAATILLVLFFLYDIFMVFITPSIFGDSVMVEVATAGGANQASTIVRNSTTGSGGGGGGSGILPMEECVRTPAENIPMLFMFPRFNRWPSGNSMLGYGDIIFPSILISHVLRFDYTVRGRMCCCNPSNVAGRTEPREGSPYFPFLIIGYAVGLLLAFGANYFEITINGVHGQPALLYLVPCTLGLHLVLSWKKSELSEQWGTIETNGLSEENDDNENNSEAVSPNDIAVEESLEENEGDLVALLN
jgi:signal peptide peptidase-like 2B